MSIIGQLTPEEELIKQQEIKESVKDLEERFELKSDDEKEEARNKRLKKYVNSVSPIDYNSDNWKAEPLTNMFIPNKFRLRGETILNKVKELEIGGIEGAYDTIYGKGLFSWFNKKKKMEALDSLLDSVDSKSKDLKEVYSTWGNIKRLKKDNLLPDADKFARYLYIRGFGNLNKDRLQTFPHS